MPVPAPTLVTAAGSGIVSTIFVAPFTSRLPGGPIATGLIGVGAMALAVKTDGHAKSILIGAGAGLVFAAALQFVGPKMRVSA